MTTMTKGLPEPRVPSLPFRIDVAHGPNKGASFHLERTIYVGTSELCALRLTDPAVSRRHLRLEPRGRRVRVVDEGSKNGIWVGQAKVLDIELPALAEIKIGETTLKIDVDRKRAETTPAVATIEGFGRFVGSAPVLAPIFDVLQKTAASDATILLEGESGVGKEVLAEAIHEKSARKDGAFVVVDCGAIAPALLEAELFGQSGEKERAGAFEQARGGTLLLDEVGELPTEMQTRLLAVLDRKKAKRVGGDSFDVDVRILAATHRNLDKEVEEGRFRLDLFHRLAVVTVRVPALRERPEDVEALARHFLTSFGVDPVKQSSLLTTDVLERLQRHGWPGNARELRNHVERLVLLGDRALLPPPVPGVEAGADFDAIAKSGLPYRQARELAIEKFTERYVEDMLERHRGNVTRAAAAAGIARRHFHRLKRASAE